MSTTIAGHTMSRAEIEALNAVVDYMRKNSGDTWWSPTTCPKGDGRTVSVYEIFPERNNQDNARRRTVTRLHRLGVLKACCIDFNGSTLKGRPFSYFADAEAVGGGR